MSPREKPEGARSPTIAIVAAETGLATSAGCPAVADSARGRSGRTPAA
nr:hypothetical protein [Poseidonocella sp. HB161398]